MTIIDHQARKGTDACEPVPEAGETGLLAEAEESPVPPAVEEAAGGGSNILTMQCQEAGGNLSEVASSKQLDSVLATQEPEPCPAGSTDVSSAATAEPEATNTVPPVATEAALPEATESVAAEAAALPSTPPAECETAEEHVDGGEELDACEVLSHKPVASGRSSQAQTPFSDAHDAAAAALEAGQSSDDDDAPPPLRVVDAKRSITLDRANTRDPVSDNEADDLVALMDSAQPISSDGSDGSAAAAPRNPYATGPDPMLAWKATVLRTLRQTDDGAMTVATLAALAPNPVEGSSYTDHLQEHLIDRVLAKWVVQGESVQLVTS